MKIISGIGGNAQGICAALMVLAGCGGGATGVAPRATWQAPMRQVQISPAAACVRRVCIYLANATNSMITAYTKDANGDVAPVSTIAGSNTGLSYPDGIALNAAGGIYALNDSTSVTVYAAGANGDVAPIRTISGQKTKLKSTYLGLALDSSKNVYVVNRNRGLYCRSRFHCHWIGHNYVTVYAARANGNKAPIRRIGGSETGMDSAAPESIALDALGNLYVSTGYGCLGYCNGNSVFVYAAGANGNVAPIRTIYGSQTGLSYSEGIALDASGNIYVVNGAVHGHYSTSLTVYAAGANGNVAPIRTISGSNTRLTAPRGIALDKHGAIYVVNCCVAHYYYSAVLVYAAGANGNVAPIRAISGPYTGQDQPYGIAVH
jgi:hypothetical protein